MIIIDSSGWIEYFSNGRNANMFAKYIQEKELVVPTVILYEVYKILLSRFGDEDALTFVTSISGHSSIVHLTPEIALRAAQISKDEKLAMADSIIAATSEVTGASIVTSDADLKSRKNVIYIQKN